MSSKTTIIMVLACAGLALLAAPLSAQAPPDHRLPPPVTSWPPVSEPAPIEVLQAIDAPEAIDAIHNQTSFEAVTGRKKGEEKAAVVRKGAVREWAEVLSEEEKKQAWQIAGKQLHALGYPKM